MANSIPTFDDMFLPTLRAISNLGGSAKIQEIDEKVADLLNLTEDQVELLHNPDKSSQTELSYRLGWSRTYLRKTGYIENSGRGVWSLTALGKSTQHLDQREIVQKVKELYRQENERKGNTKAKRERQSGPATEGDNALKWREELFTSLLQMESDAFERLCQRILRENGFTQVEVIGRGGDGGIDGIGVVRISGFLSFKVLFQCKRWANAVGAGVVRDFRGAMTGRTEKGLIITTGNFTPAATREATRDGAPEIDLIDGEQLIDKLAELDLGVTKEMVPAYTVHPEFFDNI